MNKFTKLFILAIAVFGVFLLAGSAKAATYLNVSLDQILPAKRDVHLNDIKIHFVTLNLTNLDSSTEPLAVSTLYIGTNAGPALIFSRMTLYNGDKQIAVTTQKSGSYLVFRNLNLIIGVGETKTVAIYGDVNKNLKNNDSFANQLGVITKGGIIARGTKDRRYSVVSGNFPVVGDAFNLIIPRSYGHVEKVGETGGVKSINRGSQNVNLFGFTITNEAREGHEGNDLILDSVKLTNYGTAGANAVFSSTGLYVGDRLVATGKKSGKQYIFSKLNQRINIGETYSFSVKANIANNARLDQTVILGVDLSSDLIGHNANLNGGNRPTIFYGAMPIKGGEFKIIGDGQLSVRAESNPATTNVVAGMAEVPMLNLRFTATNGAFNINKLRIAQTNDALFDRSLRSITIKYQNQAGQTISSTQNLNNDGNADFNISEHPAYIPANGSGIVNVYANLNPINQTYGAFTGDSLELTFRASQNFEARGVGNNQVIQNVGNRDISGNDMVIHGTVPTIEADVNNNTALTNGPVDLYRFKVNAAEGTDLSLKKVSFKLNLTDSVITAASLTLKNFEILEGSSYGNALALTQADSGVDSYQIYNGNNATTTTANGQQGGKLSNADAYMYANEGVGQNAIVVFNDDRLIPAGQSKYYILRATAQNVDTGASSNDFVSTYMYDGDQSTTAYKGLEATCDVNGVAGKGSKYCLSSDGRNNDTAAYFIWSDTTGTEGNLNHIDINADDQNGSQDWFNGWKIRTLSVQRILN